jgi:hypothetical protein
MYPNPNSANAVSSDPTSEATKIMNVMKMKQALQQLGAGQPYQPVGQATPTPVQGDGQ